MLGFCQRSFRWLVVAPFALLLTLSAGAQPASRSPFLPAGAPGGAAANTAAVPFELRGIMATSQGPRFLIFDFAKQTGVWVGLNDRNSDAPFVVQAADLAQEDVSLQLGDRAITLKLRMARQRPHMRSTR